MAKVIFVGAGPVGLFTAIQLKLYDPNISILMMEKYEEYQRKHPLMLNPSSFNDLPPNEDFKEFVSHLPKTMRTSELETSLLQYAKKLGIQIQYTHVLDCKALRKEHRDVDIFVGSDGSHSVVHEKVFNNEYQIQKTMQYIAEIKYEVKGSTRYLNKLMEAIPAITYANHFISEFIGKEKNGITPVSIRIFINHNDYEAMKSATFKNPFHLSNEEKIPSTVLASMKAWLIARESMAHENRIENSEKITVTHLPVYASKQFVQQKHNKTWFLVGDAAFGMPYFRSLNNGILCSSQLARVIYAMVNHVEKMDDTIEDFYPDNIRYQELTPVQYYQLFVKDLVKKEDFRAEIKNLGVNSLGLSTHCMQKSHLYSYIQKGKLGLFEGGRDYKERMREEKIESKPSCQLF